MSDNPQGRRCLLAHAQVDASEVYTCEVDGYRTGPNRDKLYSYSILYYSYHIIRQSWQDKCSHADKHKHQTQI
ncbi:hypothetical protein DFH28DRAFT_1122775 [Melampsora americana]|nr:hypothetical protein DFH28DRAFT_1122775 [Melampsora americana]